MDILAASPEYAQLQLKMAEANLPLQYGSLYRKLGLSAEQIQGFESLMMERQQILTDIMAAARANGVSVAGPALRQLNDPGYGVVDTKLRDLLGPVGFESYKAYNATSRGIARSTADLLAMRLYATEAPLVPSQADELVQIISNLTPKPSGGGFYQMVNQPDWPTVYAQAKEVLSPPQLATLQAVNRAAELGRQLSELSDKLVQEAAAKAGK